jgi:hypothetical protein
MRHRIGISCAAISCLGSTLVALASCEDSSSSPSQGLDGSVSPDVSRPDVSTPDASTSDTYVPPNDASLDAGCSPHDLSGFTVPAYVPAREQMFVCLSSQYEALAEACVGDASTQSACASFATGNDGGIDSNCASCFDPANVDAGIGPLVRGSVIAPNVAGCVETAERSDAGFDCARAIAAAAACVEYACKPSCPVTDEPSRHAYLACASAAATGVCAIYTQAANTCATTLAADNSQVSNFCFPPDAGPVVQFSQIARYFCLS